METRIDDSLLEHASRNSRRRKAELDRPKKTGEGREEIDKQEAIEWRISYAIVADGKVVVLCISFSAFVEGHGRGTRYEDGVA